MGKQWLLYKIAGDTTNTKSAGKSRKSRNSQKLNNTTSSSSGTGCMNAIFHMFDIQHHHLPFNQTSFINISPPLQDIYPKGVEAPRNSLELDEQQQQHMDDEPLSSSSKKLKQETNNFIIPMGGIQIKTKRTRLMEQDNNVSSSECSSSSPAGSKTPNLVARLMGLDLLPENSSPRPSLSSPRPSSSSSHATPLNPLSKLLLAKSNARSLPGTPRMSTAGRPSTEGDYHHRLSLQNGKENKRRYDDERSSTSDIAKQIAKQVRENISRRVGADITNVDKMKDRRRDEFLVVLKPKRPSSTSSSAAPVDKSRNLDQGNGRGKENEPIQLSPRLRLLEIKNSLNKPISNSPLSSTSSKEATTKPPSSSSTTKSQPLIKEQAQVMKHENPLMKVQKCKKIANEKYDLRLKKMHQQDDQFMKKCNKKSTPLSKHLVNVNTTTTKFICFKKDISSHPSTTTTSTTLPQTQVPCITQLPNCQNRSYNTKKTHNLSFIDDVSIKGEVVATTTGSSFSDHFEYISKILSHSGIVKTTLISIAHWYSPSHPLHPSIFQEIEKLHPITTTTNAATRKLVFDVADELLVQILKPYISFKPWVSCKQDSHRMYGSELIEKLCQNIQTFPNKDCRVMEDIDGLIENDMNGITRVVGKLAFEEEAEEIVAELERDMVDTLVGEVALIICHVGW